MKEKIIRKISLLLIVILAILFATPQALATTTSLNYATSFDLSNLDSSSNKITLCTMLNTYLKTYYNDMSKTSYTNNIQGSTSKSKILKKYISNGNKVTYFKFTEGVTSSGLIYTDEDNAEYTIGYYVAAKHYYDNNDDYIHSENIIVKVRMNKYGRLEKILGVNAIGNLNDSDGVDASGNLNITTSSDSSEHDRSIIGHGNDLTFLRGFTIDESIDNYRIIKTGDSSDVLFMSCRNHGTEISFIKYNKNTSFSTSKTNNSIVYSTVRSYTLNGVGNTVLSLDVNKNRDSTSTDADKLYKYVVFRRTGTTSTNATTSVTTRTYFLTAFNFSLETLTYTDSNNTTQTYKALKLNKSYNADTRLFGSLNLSTKASVKFSMTEGYYAQQGLFIGNNGVYLNQNYVHLIKENVNYFRNRILKFNWSSFSTNDETSLINTSCEHPLIRACTSSDYYAKGAEMTDELETAFFIKEGTALKCISTSSNGINHRLFLVDTSGNSVAF